MVGFLLPYGGFPITIPVPLTCFHVGNGNWGQGPCKFVWSQLQVRDSDETNLDPGCPNCFAYTLNICKAEHGKA